MPTHFDAQLLVRLDQHQDLDDKELRMRTPATAFRVIA